MTAPEAPATSPPPAPVDARLVPAALLAWAAAFAAVAMPAALTAGLAAVTVGVSLWPVRVVVAEWRGRGGRRLRVRHRAPPVRSPAAGLLLVLACTAAVLGTTAVQLHSRGTGLLAELAEREADAQVTATVAAEARRVHGGPVWQVDPQYRVRLTVDEVRGQGRLGAAHAQTVLIGPGSWADVELGARVEVRGTLVPTQPGDAAAALLFTDAPPELLSAPHGHLMVVNLLRSNLREVTSTLSPQAQGLVPGIAVGDDRALPADLGEAMRATSLTHLTAVSGAHVAILLGSVLLLMAWLPRSLRVVVGGAALIAFVALVRPEASVLRSAVMGAVVLGALALGRPARALPALCAAVVLLVLVDPWLARSYGFALSVLATAGLVLLARPWARWLSHRLPRWLAAVVAVPAAAQAMCGPVVVLLNPALSLYAVPANVLAAPAVPPATVLGVLATVLAPWWPGAGVALATAASWFTWWIALLARLFAGLPGAQVSWPAGIGGVAALVLLTVLVVLVLRRARVNVWRPSGDWRRSGVIALVVVLLVVMPGPRRLVSSWVATAWPPAGWVAMQCDVGQGNAFVLRSGDGAAVMVDVGPREGGGARCLTDLGVRRLDLLVLTHAHADHVGALDSILATVQVTRVLLSPGTEPSATVAAVLQQLSSAGVPVERPVAGLRGTAGTVDWSVLWPTPGALSDLAGADGVNDLSVVVRLHAPALTALALGDLELDGQAGLRRELRATPAGDVDVLLMAHHGSARQDEELVAMVSGRLVLVGVGRDNDYGHPAAEALALYARGGALVRRTDECGPVAVLSAEPSGLAVLARHGDTDGCTGEG